MKIYDTVVHSKEWKAWAEYLHQEALQERLHFDIDETMELGVMGENHWNAFIKFTKQEMLKRVGEKIKSMSLKSENSIDKLPEDSEQNRITNLLNENMVIGYQVALNDLLSSLDKEINNNKE